jgi:hypothetical protein
MCRSRLPLLAAPWLFVLCFVRAISLGTVRGFFGLYRLHNQASFRYLRARGFPRGTQPVLANGLADASTACWDLRN